jgi:hypothetical protein
MLLYPVKHSVPFKFTVILYVHLFVFWRNSSHTTYTTRYLLVNPPEDRSSLLQLHSLLSLGTCYVFYRFFMNLSLNVLCIFCFLTLWYFFIGRFVSLSHSCFSSVFNQDFYSLVVDFLFLLLMVSGI